MDRQPPVSASDRVLRAVTIINFVPTFCFLLPYAIIANKVVEPLGIIPAGLSAIYSTVCLLRKNQTRWRLLWICCDAFLAVATFSFLMASWIDMPYGWADKRLTMVGTYGTFGLMVNFVIHTFLALREISYILRDGLHRECPHCHHDLSAPSPLGRMPSFRRQIILGSGQAGSSNTKEDYRYPLTGQYDEDARESSEIMSTCPPTERFSAETLRSSQRNSSSSSRETAKLVEA